MRYVTRNDERLMIREEVCACGHSLEEHSGPDGICQGEDGESGETCTCASYEAEEAEPLLVL